MRLLPPDASSQLSQSLLKKMAVLLKEYGVGDNLLPTKSVCDAYDELRRCLLGLLSMQGAISKREKLYAALLQQVQANEQARQQGHGHGQQQQLLQQQQMQQQGIVVGINPALTRSPPPGAIIPVPSDATGTMAATAVVKTRQLKATTSAATLAGGEDGAIAEGGVSGGGSKKRPRAKKDSSGAGGLEGADGAGADEGAEGSKAKKRKPAAKVSKVTAAATTAAVPLGPPGGEYQ